MNSILSALLVLGCTFSARLALAEDAKDVPPPTPPFVAPVAEMMDWTVVVKNPPKAPPPQDTPQRPDWRISEVHSTRTGSMKRDIIKLMDGTSKEHWFVESMLLWPNLQGEVGVSDMSGAASVRGADDDSPSVPTGFPGVGWVNLGNFQSAVTFNKLTCYHYALGNMEAWIDVKTRLPVAYKSSGTLYQFTFDAPPANQLVLPPDYQKAWDVAQKMINNRKRVWKDLGGTR